MSPDLTMSKLASRESFLVLSVSKRAILASGKSLLSSDSSNFVPKPLCMTSGCLQEGQEVGTGL